ncbi:MAG: PhoH family protein [Xenococcus sp. MO_188.B8]|nr:PhoH family protein [Xenococcus sp. MO_188.B8]
MKKIFVLDTNVLLHDSQAIFRFEDNDIILPMAVIEELDRFKKQPDSIGRSAREVSRILDHLRQLGNLTQGILLDSGGTLSVKISNRETVKTIPEELGRHLADNVVLAVALESQQKCQCPVIVISKDTNLRIKADVLGLKAEDYETDKVNIEQIYSNISEIVVSTDEINKFFHQGFLLLETPLLINQAVTLIDSSRPSHTALAMVKDNGDREASTVRSRIIPLIKIPHSGVSRIHPRNREQQFALNLLLTDSIQLVTLIGQAGTGKTLLAIAAGLQKVADEKIYSRLLISRPIIAMGKDIGYLPGDIEEKLTPWMQPIYDNLDLIFGTQDAKGKPSHWRRGHEELLEQGLLQIEPLTYIRGRTIPRQFLIVDEAQNLTPHEVKTILTRAGEGTKIVLTGDPEQIDNPYVDAASNGLTFVAERFKNEPLAGHITLYKGERSPLSERAATLL